MVLRPSNIFRLSATSCLLTALTARRANFRWFNTLPVAMKRKNETLTPSPARPKRTKVTVNYAEDQAVPKSPSPAPTRRRAKHTKVKVAVEDQEEVDEKDDTTAPTKAAKSKSPAKAAKSKTKSKRKAKAEQSEDDEQIDADPKSPKPKQQRKRKPKEVTEEISRSRTTDTPILIGPHVSAAGGIHNGVANALSIGASAFGIFLKNQRRWANPPLDPATAAQFVEKCKHHGYDSLKCVVPHGSYLVNMAHVDNDRAKQAYESFIDDLGRAKEAGIGLYNIHPGNCSASTRDEAITQLAKQLNTAFKDPRSGKVVVLLETMATQGNTLGGTFEDLAAIIAQVEQKDRIGICLDTCHVFAAGYDLRAPDAYNATISQLDNVVGLQYLRAIHVNDSKAPFASFRDLHANIGTGFLGLRAFHNLANDQRLWGKPMVLETPGTELAGWGREIELIESLVGMDMNSPEFNALETRFHAIGAPQRELMNAQIEKKKEKQAKKGQGRKKKGKEEKVDQEEAEEDEGGSD